MTTRLEPVPLAPVALVREHITVWFKRWVAAWRAAYAVADTETREHAAGWMDLRVAVRATFVQCTSQTTPIVATAIAIEWHELDADAVDVIDIQSVPEIPWVAEPSVIAQWAAQRDVLFEEETWHEGARFDRAPDRPSRSRNGDHAIVSTRGVLWLAEPEEFAHRDFVPRAKVVHRVAKTPPMSEEPHVSDAGEARESTSLRRTLSVRPEELFNALQLFDSPVPPAGTTNIGWFAILGIPFEQLGAGHGDVDLVVGRMRLQIDCGDLDEQARRAARESESNKSMGLSIVLARLLRLQPERLIWPPPLEYLSAAEVKTSWFDPLSRTWKRRHVKGGGASEVLRQLRNLLRLGFDRTSFVHLAASRPVARGPLGALSATIQAPDTFPVAFGEDELPDVGYLSSFIHATKGQLEHQASATEPFFSSVPELDEPRRARKRPAPLNPLRSQPSAAAVREKLSTLLGDVPRPRAIAAYLGWCGSCERLSSRHAPLERTCTKCGKLLAGERAFPPIVERTP